MRRVGRHVRGNLIAYIALFCALGLGTASAVERNSIGTKEIANDSIRSADVRDDDQKSGGLDAGDLAPEAVGVSEQDQVPTIRLFQPTTCDAGGDVDRVAWIQRDFQTPGLGGFMDGCAQGAGAVQVDAAGIYQVTANLVWDPDPAGTRTLQIWRSDSPSPQADTSVGATQGPTGQSVSEVLELDANDEVYARAVEDSGSQVPFSQGDFSVVWLGPAP